MDYPKRKLPRLRSYDYSKEGYYFITICTHEMKRLFGTTETLNEVCVVAEKELREISNHFDGVRVDRYVVMPNHIHMVLVLGCDGVTNREKKLPSVSTIVGLYKSGVSRKIRQMYPQMTVWQKSFYDTIIKNKDMYKEIIKYIYNNPITWDFEKYHLLRKRELEHCRERS